METARLRFVNASVFVKCLLLMAGATILVATVLSVLSVRTVNRAVDNGVRDLGAEVTAGAALVQGSALRFGNAEAVGAALEQIVERSDGAALRGVAVDARGEVVAEAGPATDGAGDALNALAQAAAATGEPQADAEGFMLAYPSFAGADGSTLAGAIAFRWSPEMGRDAARLQQAMNLGASALVLVLLLVGAAALLKVAVSRPITDLAGQIVTLTGGTYDEAIPHEDRGDEIGTIARNLGALQAQLARAARAAEERALIEATQTRVVQDLTVALQRLAEGDLTRPIEAAFPPGYEPLRQNYNETVATILRVIEQMARNAGTIRGSAAAIADSSADLSARTENQAASLEETAAALDMITRNVNASAVAAQDVERIVTEARARALQSSSVVEQTVDAMSRIEESSRQITRITSVIDEIAFQTNLLALNAGVEAARAGEAGRGFSVVANEVRALAQRSSDAANEIKGLIADSSGHVGRGVELVASAGAELSAITESVSTISAHVEGISRSAREQSASLAEVNSGVSQLDRVTQQNAAMVSEASEASQTLRGEAEIMAQSIAVFRLPGASVDTDRAAPHRLSA
ncbi:methyl-accepting chemotaxis protein [Roseibacterium sp. SDUM158016]|uniref:methyl-accepting chemotaxis protein n=1 Tax=Roseicyclus sediminis TaxID=2980997 RepID=UPI0021D3A140|nr:methyl-accepting chemotaxis protein [Roseibacterium sp. SDUM158016]MCU4651999.1 methyl-accepting chemotaxis protein [Roseibacterium sp. SDUM158016]